MNEHKVREKMNNNEPIETKLYEESFGYLKVGVEQNDALNITEQRKLMVDTRFCLYFTRFDESKREAEYFCAAGIANHVLPVVHLPFSLSDDELGKEKIESEREYDFQMNTPWITSQSRKKLPQREAAILQSICIYCCFGGMINIMSKPMRTKYTAHIPAIYAVRTKEIMNDASGPALLEQMPPFLFAHEMTILLISLAG
jgi:hypothetical protein